MSEPIKLSLEEARSLAHQVVEEAGEDFVYHDRYEVEWTGEGELQDDVHGSKCRYEFQGQACCLVGRVLHRAGVTIEELKAMDRDPLTGFDYVKLPDRLDLDPDARNFLNEVQVGQDNGLTWGKSLQSAEYDL